MPLNDRDIITIIKTNKTMMNLEKLGLSSEDMLQRSQLATIIGGDGVTNPSIDNPGGWCDEICGWKIWTCQCGYGDQYYLMTDKCDPTCFNDCGEQVTTCS